MSRKTVSESTFNKPVSMADSLNVTGSVDANSIELTAGINVGGTIVQENSNTSQLGKNLELGWEGFDQSSLIDFHSSSDGSQSDYSARLIRGSGVNGVLNIDNLGTGAINILGGGSIGLNPASGLIFCNSSRLLNVANPIDSTDAANKDYVDEATGRSSWARATNATASIPTISAGNGVSSIAKTATGRYTINLASAVSTGKNLDISYSRIGSASSNQSIIYDRDGSTTTAIKFEIANSSGDYTSPDEFIISIKDLD